MNPDTQTTHRCSTIRRRSVQNLYQHILNNAPTETIDWTVADAHIGLVELQKANFLSWNSPQLQTLLPHSVPKSYAVRHSILDSTSNYPSSKPLVNNHKTPPASHPFQTAFLTLIPFSPQYSGTLALTIK